MEAVSQKFEQDAGLSEEVEKQVDQNEGAWFRTQCIDDTYSPYCDMKFEESPETVERAQGLLHHTDCTSVRNCTREYPSLAMSAISASGELVTPLKNDEYLNEVGFSKNVDSHDTSASQESVDSDSEMFRVKRRSPMIVEKRVVNDTMNSKFPEQQVLKRLKKLHSGGSSECAVSVPTTSSFGQIAPLTIKIKPKPFNLKIPTDLRPIKLRLKEQSRKDYIPVSDSKKPSTELKPKRLKIREAFFSNNVVAPGS